MAEHTTQRAGVIDQTPGPTIIGEDFEDRFGDWLSAALDIPRDNVRPGWKPERLGAPEEVAVFSLGTREPDEPTISAFADGQYEVEYTGRIDIAVTLYGRNARYLSWLLCDLFAVEQNAYELLSRCGLGYIGAVVQAQILESVGGQMRERADVIISCNYAYTRTWAVRTIVEAQAKTYFD